MPIEISKIEYNPDFIEHFDNLWHFIARDSTRKADNFKKLLQNKIEKLIYFPCKFRKSIYYNDENIRNFIFKGYTIPYLVDKKGYCIVTLDIFKWMDR